MTDSWFSNNSNTDPSLDRSRTSSASTNFSQTGAGAAVSPAQSFLSSFSGRDALSSSMTGRLASSTPSFILDGDDEGFVVAGYVLGRELGKGGFGVVREATKITGSTTGGKGDKVAVKVVRHRQSHQLALSEIALEEERWKRSASGYRTFSASRGGVARDRRMSLVNDARHRSVSTPVPAHVRETARERIQDSSVALNVSWTGDQMLNDSALSDGDKSPSTVPSALTLVQALLEREIHLWRQLSPHPHIVQLIDTHKTEDFTYIFMPLCEGGNLLDFLNEGGFHGRERAYPRRGRTSSIGIIGLSSITEPTSATAAVAQSTKGLPLDAVKLIFAQIVEGLHFLHNDASVTHKDIKLDNILCDERPEKGGTWKIADFGLAELSTPGAPTGAAKSRSSSRSKSRPRAALGVTSTLSLASLSRANSLNRPDSCTSQNRDLPALDSIDEHLHPAGSLPYQPPEQMRSPIPILDPSVDVWALGCVLYAMIEGVLPFQDEFEPRLRMKIMKGVWEVPPSLSARIEAGDDEAGRCLEVLKGCLESDPKQRWTIKQVRESRWLQKKQQRQ